MITRIPGLVGATLLGLAAIVVAPTASAAIVTGSWDPVLPAPFVNLGWVATVNMQINNNCVSGRTNEFSVNIFGSSFGCMEDPRDDDFSVLRAQVGVYSTLTGAIVDVLQFTPPPGGLAVSLEELIGGDNTYLLNLGESNAVGGAAVGTTGFNFKLALRDTLPVLSYSGAGGFIDATGDPELTVFRVRPDEDVGDELSRSELKVGQIVAGPVPASVPEPGSLALALLALGAAAGTARRSPQSQR